MLLLDATLAIVKNNQWHPEIGDRTFLGWFTVIAYLLTAILAIIATVNTSHLKLSAQQLENHRLIWGLIALILLFLGINKQLDLQTWLTVTGKNLALSEGWYEQRRIVQAIFIISIAIFGLVFLAFVLWLIKENQTNARWGLIGLGMLTCFVIIRAASFHHVDQLIGLNLLGVRVNNILELGGIGAIALSAWKNLKTFS